MHRSEAGADEDQGADAGKAIGESRGQPTAFTVPEHGGAIGIDAWIRNHAGVGQRRVFDQDRFGLRGIRNCIAYRRRRTDPALVVAKDSHAPAGQLVGNLDEGLAHGAIGIEDRFVAIGGSRALNQQHGGEGSNTVGRIVELPVRRHPATQPERYVFAAR